MLKTRTLATLALIAFVTLIICALISPTRANHNHAPLALLATITLPFLLIIIKTPNPSK